MIKNYFLNKIHSLQFFSQTALQAIIILLPFIGVTVKANATSGPAVTICRAIGNTTTLQTEVKKLSHFTQNSSVINGLQDRSNAQAWPTAYKFVTQYGCFKLLSKMGRLYHSDNNYKNIGTIQLDSNTANFSNNLFAHASTIGFVKSTSSSITNKAINAVFDKVYKC